MINNKTPKEENPLSWVCLQSLRKKWRTSACASEKEGYSLFSKEKKRTPAATETGPSAWAVLQPICGFSTSCNNILNWLPMIVSLTLVFFSSVHSVLRRSFSTGSWVSRFSQSHGFWSKNNLKITAQSSSTVWQGVNNAGSEACTDESIHCSTNN